MMRRRRRRRKRRTTTDVRSVLKRRRVQFAILSM